MASGEPRQVAGVMDNAMLFAGVYDDVDTALLDLSVLGELHMHEVLGKYDAAVIVKQMGEPDIVRQPDRPAVRVIPELFGGGTLPRKQLHEIGLELRENQAALASEGALILWVGATLAGSIVVLAIVCCFRPAAGRPSTPVTGLHAGAADARGGAGGAGRL